MKYFLILSLCVFTLLSIHTDAKENNNQIESLLKEVIQLNQNIQELVKQYKKKTDEKPQQMMSHDNNNEEKNNEQQIDELLQQLNDDDNDSDPQA